MDRDITIAMDYGLYLPKEYQKNAAMMRSSVETAKRNGCDIVCFPEASLTGYSTTEDIALPKDDPLIKDMIALSDGIVLIFGAFVIDSGKRITQYVCKDGKVIGRYRKTHLGMNETSVVPGDELPVFDLGYCRIGFQICWEMHFPQMTATYRKKGADIVLNPTATYGSGDRRMTIWKRIVPARSDDNRIYCASCNLDGGSSFCSGPNGIEINGDIIGDHLRKYTLDHALLNKYRELPETMRNIDYPSHFRPELYDFE